MPNWSGFHYEVAPEDEQGLPTAYYLPTIDGSPTKMEVIQELLSQIKIKAEHLCLKSADAVFDHAIYAKALEVLTNPVNEELQNFINLRMGGFHASCIFISVIGERLSCVKETFQYGDPKENSANCRHIR